MHNENIFIEVTEFTFMLLQNISLSILYYNLQCSIFSAHVLTLLDDAKKLQFILVLLSKARGIQLLLFYVQTKVVSLRDD